MRHKKNIGVGHHRPPLNCVIFYQGIDTYSDRVPYKEICMVGPQKLTTLKFNLKTFGLQRTKAIHTPFNTQVSLFLQGKSVLTIPWETNNRTTMFKFDSVEIINMKDTFHANYNNMMAFVNGFVITPPRYNYDPAFCLMLFVLC